MEIKSTNEDNNQKKYTMIKNKDSKIHLSQTGKLLASNPKTHIKKYNNEKKNYPEFDIVEKNEKREQFVNTKTGIIEKIICFLFSSEAKIEDIKFDTKNEIYPFGETVKDGKTFNIYYIETPVLNSNIKIDVGKNSFFLKLDNIKFHKSKIFLFNKDLIDENNRKIGKLNCFDINEEFDLYYEFHSKEKNIKNLDFLISSTMNIFENVNENSNFSFLVNIIMKDSFELINKRMLEEILLNIKNKGDLTKISKEKLNEIYICRKDTKILQIIILIYMILSEQNIDEIVKFLELKKIRVVELISYLDKFENLFKNSINLFPKYTFLLDDIDSFDEIIKIFKCSKNLIDFIFFLNEKKEIIISILDDEKKEIEVKNEIDFLEEMNKGNEKDDKEKKKEINKLILNNFFDLENAFNPEFDENFYIILSNIKEFETKIHKKIFYIQDKFKQLDPHKFVVKSFIKLLIFSNIRDEKITFDQNMILKEIKKMILIKDSFNYVEIIEIIDILLNAYNKQQDDEFIETIISLIKLIKFEKIKKELKPYFSKIKWEIIFKSIYFKDVISKMISGFKNIDNFEFLFKIINKLKEKEENMENPKKGEKMKDKNIYKENIIYTIELLLKKYLSILNELNEAQNIYKDNKVEFIHATSKLIYLKFKYEIKAEFFTSITEKIETELLNDIFISTLNNYELTELNFNNIITLLIEKGKFGNIYDDLINNKEHFSKFEKLINNYIINDDIQQFFEKSNFNYLLLDILYKRNFFKSFNKSDYVSKTISHLESIGNKIINMNNISLKQMESLLNEKERLDFFSLTRIEKLIIESLNKNIKRIRDIFRIRYFNEFLFLNNFKFSELEKLVNSIKKFFDELENKKINLIKEIEEFEKKAEKIKYIFRLISNIEKIISSNYFFKIIKGKNMDYSLFQQILFILDDENIDKINTDIIPLFNSFLLIDKEEKEEIIMKLDFCNYLLKTISLNTDFEKDLQMKKVISNNTFQIYYRIIMLVMKEKIKEEFNNYLLFKEKLKHDKNNKKENNEIINNSIKQFISFIKSLRIKTDNLYNRELNDIIEELKNNTFIKIINNLFKNKEAIDFLFSITSQDCRNIQELAGEVHGGNNQNFLSIEELLLIEKIVESFEYIKNKIKITKIKMRKK